MKYQGPEGNTGASIGGEFFQADAKGCIEVPDNGNYDTLLAPHGFVQCPPQEKRKVDKATAKSAQAELPATSE